MERSIVSLASDAERETIRCWYNEAAVKTTIPDETSDHLTIMERELSAMLRVPLDGPVSAESDNEFLLRFHTEADVRRWAYFILERLAEWMEDVANQWRCWHETTGRDVKPHQPYLKAIHADPESDAPGSPTPIGSQNAATPGRRSFESNAVTPIGTCLGKPPIDLKN